MSIVGPRPLLMEYIALYSPRESMRHNVKPGITGWAQINGRNNLPWGKKFSLDIWYVKNRTFKIDILIIYKTILKVIKMENISQKGHVTVEKFSGEKMERTKFKNWNYPKIKDGLPNKYNWVVQYVDEFKLGYKTDIGAFSYINAKEELPLVTIAKLDLTALFIQSPQLIKRKGSIYWAKL